MPRIKHGLDGTKISFVWRGMKTRCDCKTNRDYKGYGGRGITVCRYIRTSPLAIINLIGDKTSTHSVDRINNDGNYSCGLCTDCIKNDWKLNIKWSTPGQQTRNRRISKRITVAGEVRYLKDVALENGLVYNTLLRRHHVGYRGKKLLKVSQKSPKNLVGKKFGNLIAKIKSPRTLGEKTKWHCLCDCGNTTTVRESNLLSGNSTTCGRKCPHRRHRYMN